MFHENHSRTILIWIGIAGLGLRLAALPLPILDDGSWLRQTQTAEAARGYIEHGFWPPAAVVGWRGDLDARLVLELPLYTWLAAATGFVTGNLDFAGRLVSVILWGCSYLILQRIWRRCLTGEEACYASLLFVIAPLSLELGAAFMPEMLIQVCAFGFLLAVLRYLEEPGPFRLAIAGLIGGVGVCVKLPELFHLYLLFVFLLWQREGFGAARRLRYWVFAAWTLGLLKLWGGYVDAVNAVHFPDWSASAHLEKFLSDYKSLLGPHPYIKVAAYLTAFVVTPVGAAFVLIGFASLLKSGKWTGLLFLWVASIAAFYLVWGPRTSMEHAYYNLPALAPLAALFGIGMARMRAYAGAKGEAACSAWKNGEAVVLALVLACAAGGAAYLFRQDRVVHDSAMWLREHVPADDLVLVKSNHSDYTVNYAHIPGYSFYSGRRTWIWGEMLPPEEKGRALETSKWLLVTKRREEVNWYEKVRQFVKRYRRPPEDMDWLTGQPGVNRRIATKDFAVYRLDPPHQLPPDSGTGREID